MNQEDFNLKNMVFYSNMVPTTEKERKLIKSGSLFPAFCVVTSDLCHCLATESPHTRSDTDWALEKVQ